MITTYQLPVTWYQACSHFTNNPPHEDFLRANGELASDEIDDLSVFIAVGAYKDFTIIRNWLDDNSYDFSMTGKFEIETFPYRQPETRLTGTQFCFTNLRDRQMFKMFWADVPQYRC